MQLAKRTAFSRPIAATAAGQTTINGATVDMQGFERVVFILEVGTIVATGVTTLKAQQGAESDGSDGADLAGTLITLADTDDDTIVVLEIVNPTERYVRPVVGRATANITIDGCVAIRHGARKVPTDVSLMTDVSGLESHVSPAEGTA